MATNNMPNYLVDQEDPLRPQDLQIPMWGDEEPAKESRRQEFEPTWDKENMDVNTMDLKSSSSNYHVDHHFDYNQSPQQMAHGAQTRSSAFMDQMPSAPHSEWSGPLDFSAQNDQFKSPEPSASSGAHVASGDNFMTPRHEFMSHTPTASGAPRRSFHHGNSVNFQPRHQKTGNLQSTASGASSSALNHLTDHQHAPKAVKDHMGFMYHNDQFMQHQLSSSGAYGAFSDRYLQPTAWNSRPEFMTPNRSFMSHQQRSSGALRPSFHQGRPELKTMALSHEFMNPQMPSSGASSGTPDHLMVHQHAPDAVRDSMNFDYLNNWRMSHEPAASGAPHPLFKQDSPTNYQSGRMDQKHFNPQMPAPGASSSPPNQFMPHQSPPSAVPNQFMVAPGPSANLNTMPLLCHPSAPAVPNPNAINFSLLNAATWQYLNALPHEMMVTNDGRAIFPKLDIGIGNLDSVTSYKVGIKLQLVNPLKYSYSSTLKIWREMERKRVDELAEQDTNEVYSTPQYGYEIMQYGLKLNMLGIYTIGNENKKMSATRTDLTEEKWQKMQKKHAFQMETKIRVFSQYKYIPLFTLYQKTVSGDFEPVATAQFPETVFITTTGYKNPDVKQWKKGQNPNTRKDYKHKI